MKLLASALAVAAGGAIGSVLRYLVTLSFISRLGPGFPWHTMAINIAGSFVIGFLAVLLQTRVGFSPLFGLFAVVGVLGGFTTFSTFSFDTLTLVSERGYLAALVYCAGSVILGLAAALAGTACARFAR